MEYGRETVVIGVTGVIGSGKSTLCRFLAEGYGFHWIDADKICHELYKNGKPGYKKIKKYFGNHFVGKQEVHRGMLRRFILKSPQKFYILNKLIHPLVTNKVNKKIVQLKKAYVKSKKPLGICIEAVYFGPHDLGKFIDQLVSVDAPDEVIFRRVKSRKIPAEQLRILLKFQRKNMPRKGIIIENNTSKNVLYKKIISN